MSYYSKASMDCLDCHGLLLKARMAGLLGTQNGYCLTSFLNYFALNSILTCLWLIDFDQNHSNL
uniref:Uncharacterized protein n=1 Tax=Tetranychus urticae TaxID=32264 RepID=T1KL78_TETUR